MIKDGLMNLMKNPNVSRTVYNVLFKGNIKNLSIFNRKRIEELYITVTKSIQRAENVNTGSSADATRNVYKAKKNQLMKKTNEECLSCQ